MSEWGSDGGYGLGPSSESSNGGSYRPAASSESPQWGSGGGYEAPPQRDVSGADEALHNLRGYFMQIRLASWPFRVASALIDYAPILALLIVKIDMAFVDFSVIGFTILNSCICQGMYGQSLGKKALGMQLILPVNARDGQVYPCFPGIATCSIRLLLHVIDAFPYPPWALCIGLWRSLLSSNNNTFSDQIVKTIVIRNEVGLRRLFKRPHGSQRLRSVSM